MVIVTRSINGSNKLLPVEHTLCRSICLINIRIGSSLPASSRYWSYNCDHYYYIFSYSCNVIMKRPRMWLVFGLDRSHWTFVLTWLFVCFVKMKIKCLLMLELYALFSHQNEHVYVLCLDFHTWFRKVMDIRISGMFLNLNRLNKRGHLDGIRHIERLVHLPMLWQQRSVVDSDRFDDESTFEKNK